MEYKLRSLWCNGSIRACGAFGLGSKRAAGAPSGPPWHGKIQVATLAGVPKWAFVEKALGVANGAGLKMPS